MFQSLLLGASCILTESMELESSQKWTKGQLKPVELERAYPCPVCDMVKKSINDLRTHVRSEHLTPSKTNITRRLEAPELTPERLKELVLDLHQGLEEKEQYYAEYCDEMHKCSKIESVQWMWLFYTFKSQLDKYRYILSAAQHPSADRAMRESLGQPGYKIPSRLWDSGFHKFHSVAFNHLPTSLDEDLCLIYYAYWAIIVQCDVTPIFRHIWKLRLGDLALLIMKGGNESDTWRGLFEDLALYRMDIPDESDFREAWRKVARTWSWGSSRICPDVGASYCRLGIAAAPDSLRSLFYYSKSLVVARPCGATKRYMEGIFCEIPGSRIFLPSFMEVQKILFTGQGFERFEFTAKEFLSQLDAHLRTTKQFMEDGFLVAIVLIAASLGFDSRSIIKSLGGHNSEAIHKDSLTRSSSAVDIMNKSLEIVLGRKGDRQVKPFIYAMLTFVHFMSCQGLMGPFADGFPWLSLIETLNSMTDLPTRVDRIGKQEFPVSSNSRTLPEDTDLHGLQWMAIHYPEGWCVSSGIVDEEHDQASWVTELEDRVLRLSFPLESTTEREDRILWLALSLKPYLFYDKETNRFSRSIMTGGGKLEE